MPFKVKERDISKIVKKSREPLQPVFEAVQNSIESISIAKSRDSKITNPHIGITFFYSKNPDLFATGEMELERIEIEDSGEGFSDENLDRFQSLFDTSKNFRNKGTGKLQIFHRFEDIEVKSRYKDDKGDVVGISFKATEYMENGDHTEYKNDLLHTIVSLINPHNNTIKEYQSYTDVNRLFLEIIEHFFLSLSLSDFVPKITISVNIGGKVESRELQESDYQKPEKKGKFSVYKTEPSLDIEPDEWKKSDESVEFEWKRFKFSPNYIKKNEVYLCSKNLPVEKRQIPTILKTAPFKDEDGVEYFYILAITSSFLDEADRVNDNRTEFTIINKKQWLHTPDLQSKTEPQIFMDDIEDEVQIIIVDVFNDLAKLKDKLRDKMNRIVNQFHISAVVQKDAEKKIRLNDRDEMILSKFYNSEAKILKNNDVNIQKEYDRLKNLDPRNTDYQEQLSRIANNIITTIPKQNCIQLGSYVARRELVVELLELVIKNELNLQKEWQQKKEDNEKVRTDHESLIHDIVFKRGLTGSFNDLWLLNEEFSYFKNSYSDKKIKTVINSIRKDLNLDEMNDDRLRKMCESFNRKLDNELCNECDIAIFPEESSCIIIEFKSHEVEGFGEYDSQIYDYCSLICEASERKINQFWGFVIGGNDVEGKPKIGRVGLKGNKYTNTVDGNGKFTNIAISSLDTQEVIGNAYIELCSYDRLVHLARTRNKAFSERLGIKNRPVQSLTEETPLTAQEKPTALEEANQSASKE